MTSVKFADRHPNDDLIRVDRLPHIWCPGCGLGEVAGVLAKAIKKSEIPIDNNAVVSGIGCTGRTAGYMNLDGYHTTHGRAIAFATGLKMANDDLNVIVVSGDGDISTIGGNHLIHAARRNIDLTVIMVNNSIYGMTGGQVSATTPHDAKTTTTVYGNPERPFNMSELMKGAGATFIARWTVLNLKQMQVTIEKAFKHRGFSFIELISPCPKGFGRKNRFREGLDLMRYFQDKAISIDMPDEHIGSELTLKPEDVFSIGEFYQDDVSLAYTDARREILDRSGKY